MMAKQPVFSTADESKTSLQLSSPEVTANQRFLASPQDVKLTASCFTDAQCQCQSQHRGGRLNPELRSYSAPGACFHHSRPGASRSYPAHVRSREDSYSDLTGATEAAAGDLRGQHPPDPQLESDDEELEPPLPLRSDDEWPHLSPCLQHHHYMYNYGFHSSMDVRCARVGHYNHSLQHSFQPQLNHYCSAGHDVRTRGEVKTRPYEYRGSDGTVQPKVSVNVPQFLMPPVGGVSQVNVKNLCSEGEEAGGSHPQERRRAFSLPDECRNIFITYSSDASSEMMPFVDFLTKQGFRPAIDKYENTIRNLDIDSHLRDPSNLVIVAISPKYKADIEGSVTDNHGLHIKYIHTMMQNEFIQQGSLNFRFIPVLFLNASQNHVPGWLKNTHLFRWPQDKEDLLLRLMREERYAPPPVPMGLRLIIRPVALGSAATL